MEIDLKRKKEFMLFFQKLQEQKYSFYTKEHLVKLKTSTCPSPHLYDFNFKLRSAPNEIETDLPYQLGRGYS